MCDIQNIMSQRLQACVLFGISRGASGAPYLPTTLGPAGLIEWASDISPVHQACSSICGALHRIKALHGILQLQWTAD